MLTIEQLKEANKTKKLKIVNEGYDPLLYIGEEKVAILFRNASGWGYTIGICFELNEYESEEADSIEEGAYKVKDFLNSVGVECSF
jgi:hypothetical protein